MALLTSDKDTNPDISKLHLSVEGMKKDLSQIQTTLDKPLDLKDIPQGPSSRLDADTVDGIQAVTYSKAGPNVLVATDHRGLLPTSIIPSTIIPTKWVKFAGATGTISGNVDVSSVVRTGTGRYTVTFSPAFSNANYSVVANVRFSTDNAAVSFNVVTQSSSVITITTRRAGGTFDFDDVYLIAVGT